MEFKIDQNFSIEDLKAKVTEAFPQYVVKSPPMNKKIIMVQKGAILAGIAQRKDKLRVYGSINTQNIGVMIGLIVGILFGLIGALVFILIITLMKKKDYKELEAEVGAKVAEIIGVDETVVN